MAAEDLRRQVDAVRKQEIELLNLRLLGEIEADTFNAKKTEFRDREARLNLQIEACGRGTHENSDLAVKAFELSQTLRTKWLTADYGEKRRYLEIIVLNFSLNDASLVPQTRKPFDLLAEGLLVSSSRDNWHPFEPLIDAYLEAAFSPSAETLWTTQLLRLPA